MKVLPLVLLTLAGYASGSAILVGTPRTPLAPEAVQCQGNQDNEQSPWNNGHGADPVMAAVGGRPIVFRRAQRFFSVDSSGRRRSKL